ncbi:SDR family oxidoreductase [Ancylomarina salipaludis]|uniref:SDR family oxidoreductase n=1 Tax=Ancylomarina salipaludis TaxID=2501299 RepID=A0A4Q1JLM5_9BACT|nr:SDR family oxidoreductase [Ancylomarina salipaludis]RXQ93864.1 SDR family oxidoreductase [Ancylomarina salipaludis]
MYNPFSLKGKTILVTGASSGIGRGTAIECSKLGATVVVTGRNSSRLNETFLALEGDNHTQVIADLSEDKNLDSLVEQCPPLDGCVLNAGIPKLMVVKFIQRESLEEIIGINTIAPIMLTSKLVKKKKLNKGASIVFVSSISGVCISTLGESSYSASKGAIHGFVKGAAIDLASKKIRVNSVNPGLVQTSILELANDVFSKEQIQDKLKLYPLKRIGQPEDVAHGVIYLLSNASSWVTGTNIVIDGGFTLT